MSTNEEVLQTIVYALGDRETALQISEAYRGAHGDEAAAVAHYVDALLCAGQEMGTLDAEDYFGSESWNEAVDEAFPEGDESDDDDDSA